MRKQQKKDRVKKSQKSLAKGSLIVLFVLGKKDGRGDDTIVTFPGRDYENSKAVVNLVRSQS